MPLAEDVQTEVRLWVRSCTVFNCGQLWQATWPLSFTVLYQFQEGFITAPQHARKLQM